MKKKKIYQAPAANIYTISIEQPLLNNSYDLQYGNEETATDPMTNKKGFADDLWYNGDDNMGSQGGGIWH